MAPKKDTAATIVIPRMNLVKTKLRLVGKTPLIGHAWSEKSKKQIRDKQTKQAKAPKEAKDPEREFEDAKYRDAEGRDCIPTIGIKCAFVSAARFADDMKMTVLRGALFVEGETVPIEFEKCNMREDMVKIGIDTADLRYRPEYVGWSVVIPIEFNASVISMNQVVHLFSLAGFSIGIFEWRPERNGQYGRFTVEEVV